MTQKKGRSVIESVLTTSNVQFQTDNPYYANIFAASAYNAGRTAVIRGMTHIPVNTQTEYYAPEVLQIYDALVQGNGRLRWEDCWLLKL